MADWFDAEKFAEDAHRYFEAGLWDKALAQLQRALAINPEQTDWLMGLGLTLDEMGRYEDAIVTYEKILSLHGEDVETLLNLGLDLLRTEQPKRAIDALERASAADPTCETAWSQRIAAYKQLGDYDEAEACFYMAVQLDEQSPAPYDQIASCLLERDEVDRAIWCWNKSLQIDPTYPDIRANLARCYARNGQLQRARQSFIKQLRLDPGDINTLIDLGRLLAEMDRPAEAREKFRRVLELDPTVADAHLYLGKLTLEAGHLDAAAAELHMAERLDAQGPGIHLGLAKVAHARGLPDKTRKHLEAELERSGQTIDELLDLADMLIDADAPGIAGKVLDALLDTDQKPPINAEERSAALQLRGEAHLQAGDIEQAITDCRAALRIDPRNTPAMEDLVVAYIEQRQFPLAHYWLHRGLHMEPATPGLRRLRYELLAARAINTLRITWQSLQRLVGRRRP